MLSEFSEAIVNECCWPAETSPVTSNFMQYVDMSNMI